MRRCQRRAILTATHVYHSAVKQQITGGFQMGLPTLALVLGPSRAIRIVSVSVVGVEEEE